MAQFSVTSATVSIGGQAYCASNFDYSYDTEVLEFDCMADAGTIAFAGTESWTATSVLAYEALGMDQLWGAVGALSVVIQTSTGEEITISGTVTNTSVSSPFNTGEVPSVTVTMQGSGALTEAITP